MKNENIGYILRKSMKKEDKVKESTSHLLFMVDLTLYKGDDRAHKANK